MRRMLRADIDNIPERDLRGVKNKRREAAYAWDGIFVFGLGINMN